MRVLFFTLLAFEMHQDGDAGKSIGVAELVVEIFFVGFVHELGIVDKDDEARRPGLDLGHVVDAQALAHEHGRVVALEAAADEFVELVRGNAPFTFVVDLFYER
jgi:hypothetical protein